MARGEYRKWLIRVGFFWLMISLACNSSLPRNATPTPDLTPQPILTETNKNEIPPVVVETQPREGSLLGWRQEITLYFNQPMDAPSVERGLSIIPEVAYSTRWIDDATVAITPQADLPVSSPITLIVDSSARALNTLTLPVKYQADFVVADALAVSSQIPLIGAVEVDPAAAVMVSFNQPVAPFGSTVEFDTPAFQLEPATNGWGEWVNSSTYLYHPEPALAGGLVYQVVINASLASQAGATFGDNPPVTYGFSTLAPGITGIDPAGEDAILIDQVFTITFNQVMLTDSVAENLRLMNAAGELVPSELKWDTSNQTVTLTPYKLLARDSDYRLKIGARCVALGGSLLRQDVEMDFRTVGSLAVTKTNPEAGAALTDRFYSRYKIEFNAPLAAQDLDALISVMPELEGQRVFYYGGNQIWLDGDFQAGAIYQVGLSEQIQDRWGGSLSGGFSSKFKVLDDDPLLSIPGLAGGTPFLYQPANESQIPVSATNLTSVSVQRAKVALDELPELMANYWSDAMIPAGNIDQWQQALTLERNESRTVMLDANQDSSPLTPGLYYFDISSPQIKDGGSFLDRPFLMVVSNLQVFMKSSPGEVFVWLARNKDLRPQNNKSVRFLRQDGSQLGDCVTGVDGTCSIVLTPEVPDDVGAYLYAVIGEPGDEDFSLGVSGWSQGVNGWSFGIPTTPFVEEPTVYLYTDRPIYKPGQTVHARIIVKETRDGRHLPAPDPSYTVKLVGTYSELTGSVPTLGTESIRLNEFDTGTSDYLLPQDAPPGIYSLQVEGYPSAALKFRVAEYRKPEIDLKVRFDAADWVAEEEIRASVQADYYFGAPADRLKVQYNLYARPETQFLPQDFLAGTEMPFWFDSPEWQFYSPELGAYVLSGEGETDAGGAIAIALPAEDVQTQIDLRNRTRLTLEVTITDASGQPVSTRAQAWLHPADFAIGIKYEEWVGRADSPMGFLVQTVGLDETLSGGHALVATFSRVEWRMRFDPEQGAIYEAERSLVSSADLVTDAGGRARLVFTPPLSGTYEINISGGGAETTRTLWVAGAGQALWPQPPNNELPISSDAKTYRVGDTASIFIPNPFGSRATALVTMERERVTARQVVVVNGSNALVELPLGALDSPNVFVSVTLIGRDGEGGLDFRQGYLELMVDPEEQILNVAVNIPSGILPPGGEGMFEITVTDHEGMPVVGDLSMALVDKAVLALADPMEPGIIEAFYGRRMLRINNGFSPAGYIGRFQNEILGKGGGGAGEVEPALQLRSRFEDTAFWQGSFRTDAAGQALIHMTLPDNLTTWVADVRGISADARVGVGKAEVIASKDLLVRPVTPAFLVAGDHVQIAAIVHNNTSRDLNVAVDLQQSGLTMDAGTPASHTVLLIAGGRQRVAWWASVSEAEQVDLVFSAQSGDLSDRTTPVGGSIPVLKYTRQDTFGTAGVLEIPGERVEVISLPRTFQPTGGSLRLELSPSLAATVFDAVDLGEAPKDGHAESLVSDLLPIVVWLPVAAELGLDEPRDLSALSLRVQQHIDALAKMQTSDGGWGWWGSVSNPQVSAYVTLGLGEAVRRGYTIAPDVLARATEYLGGQLSIPERSTMGEGLDRQVFYRYALYRAGEEWVLEDDALYDYRTELSPWSRALLAILMHATNPKDERVITLTSDLEGAAHATASGVYWQDTSISARQNWSSTNFNTAVVLLALAQIDSRSYLLAPAARYLVEQNAGMGRWSTRYEQAWALMALSETARVTGEFSADYAYTAALGEKVLAQADLAGVTALETTRVDVPLDDLDMGVGTPLRISRTVGDGRLFYRAFLSLQSLIVDQRPVERGFTLNRRYYLLGDACGAVACPAVDEVHLEDSALFILARLELVVPQDRYFVIMEDFFPAGSEAVNLNLKTSQIGTAGFPLPEYDEHDPYANGWGWWYFSQPEIGTNSIRWTAQYLPAGTYTLEYRLNPVHAGAFQVMPAHANEYFFPDVEGSSAGSVFTILPPE